MHLQNLHIEGRHCHEDYVADFSKTGKEMLVDLINWVNRNSMTRMLKHDEVEFSHPKRLPHYCDVNSAIRIRKVIGYSLSTKSEEIHYNRVDLNQVLTVLGFDFNLVLPISEKQVINTVDLLEPLNEKAKIKLLPMDIVNEEILLEWDKENLDKGIKVTLNVSDISIAYYGKVTLTILPKLIDLGHVVKKTIYKPFMPPFRYGFS